MIELNWFCFNILISSSSSSTINDTRACLKNFLNGMKTVELTKSEIEEYQFVALDKASVDAEFDILSWWKLKAPSILFWLEPETSWLSQFRRWPRSLPSVQLVETLSPVRSSLNDESIEALICVQDWLRASVTGLFSL
jgi:hypothetical protein